MRSESLKKGVLILSVAKYSNVFFTLIANAILARLLTAEDYGIVAIVTVFVTFFQLVSDMGIGTGIIQNQTIQKGDIEDLFSISFYISLILASLMFILSFAVEYVYNNAVYQELCIMLSISVFFYALNTVPNAILMRNKKFSLIGVRTIIVNVISYVIAIFCAWFDFKYYALVIQAIVNSAVTFACNYWSARIHFHFRFSLNGLKEISSYAGCDFGFNIISYFARNADNLLVGKTLGNVALGYYGKAYNLMLYPVTYLTGVISPVLHPIFAKHQDDKLYIYKQYMKVFKVLSMLGVFISIYCYIASPEIVMILYGSQWESVIPCISALSVSIWFQMTSSSCGSVYKSIGRTDLMLKSALVYVPIQLLFIGAGVYSQNIVILSWCVALSFIFKFFTEYCLLISKGFGIPVIRFYKKLWPEVVIATTMILVLCFMGRGQIDNVLLSAVYKGVLCLIPFIFMLVVTKQHAYFMEFFNKK